MSPSPDTTLAKSDPGCVGGVGSFLGTIAGEKAGEIEGIGTEGVVDLFIMALLRRATSGSAAGRNLKDRPWIVQEAPDWMGVPGKVAASCFSDPGEGMTTTSTGDSSHFTSTLRFRSTNRKANSPEGPFTRSSTESVLQKGGKCF